jgi:hypothetical protein
MGYLDIGFKFFLKSDNTMPILFHLFHPFRLNLKIPGHIITFDQIMVFNVFLVKTEQ